MQSAPRMAFYSPLSSNQRDVLKENNIVLNVPAPAAPLPAPLDQKYLHDAQNIFFILPKGIFSNIFKLSQDMVLLIARTLRMRFAQDDIGMPIERQLLITLIYYANGEYQEWPEGMDASPESNRETLNGIIRRVTLGIATHMADWVKFPISPYDRVAAVTDFETSDSPFPGAIGVMDNFHVKLDAPDSQERVTCFGFQKIHTVNVQMVCNPKLKILYINPRFPGSVHDNQIWVSSSIHKNMSAYYNEGERNTWLLGDNNYGLQPWLMTPVQGAELQTPEDRYNKAHSRACDAIEECVRSLRGTWRVLNNRRPIKQDPVIAANIVNVCAILHNMRIAANAPLIKDDVDRRLHRKRACDVPKSSVAAKKAANFSDVSSLAAPSEIGRPAPKPMHHGDAIVMEAARRAHLEGDFMNSTMTDDDHEGLLSDEEEVEEIHPRGPWMMRTESETAHLVAEAARLEGHVPPCQPRNAAPRTAVRPPSTPEVSSSTVRETCQAPLVHDAIPCASNSADVPIAASTPHPKPEQIIILKPIPQQSYAPRAVTIPEDEANVGGRLIELALAKMIRARLIQRYFSQ